ncbi:redoxin domain-containing protein [Candidatus Acetothermia bacterium]|nr:redoxin domain-containing protein [Candidatus Acetothermia bacterium]
MAVRIGKPVPNVETEAWVRGAHGPKKIALSQYQGKWIVLFFYPRDFTFICPTEIAAFAAKQQDFEREDAVVISASTDSFHTHKAWFESDPRLAGVKYPVLADTSHEVCRAFDVLLEDGAALRGTFIIDPEGIVRHITLNELDVGRNVDETLRVLQALRTGELCPVGWKPGQATLTSYDEWLAKALPRLSKELLVQTTQKLQTVKFSAGEMVFERGDAPDHFYIVVRGEVEVIRRDPHGREQILSRLQPGDFFGEIGLLTEARRTAAVRAKTDLEVLALDWDAFRKVVEASEPTSTDFAKIVRERLAKT